jgi:hypothetical protein
MIRHAIAGDEGLDLALRHRLREEISLHRRAAALSLEEAIKIAQQLNEKVTAKVPGTEALDVNSKSFG